MTGLFNRLSFSNLDAETRSNLKDNRLTRFTQTRGGSMTGDSHSIDIIAAEGGRAVISFADAEWHFQDPTVREYLADGSILAELEAVFRQYRMESWHNKTFTKDFICDGGSTGYSFYFGTPFADVHFSSQIYPPFYSSKIDEFYPIIKRYTAEENRLPSLVLPERTDEVPMARRAPNDGKITFTAYEYCRGSLFFRITNGTDNEIALHGSYKLCKIGSDAPVAVKENPYGDTVSAHEVFEDSLRPETRLEAGSYVLTIDGFDLECSFEIE